MKIFDTTENEIPRETSSTLAQGNQDMVSQGVTLCRNPGCIIDLLPHLLASHLLTSIHWKFGCNLFILLLVLDHINPSSSMPHIPLTTWRDLTQLKMKFEEKPQPPWQKEIKMGFPKRQLYKEEKSCIVFFYMSGENSSFDALVHIASCT